MLRCGEIWNPLNIAGANVHVVTALENSFWKLLNVVAVYDLVTTFLNIYPQEMKNLYVCVYSSIIHISPQKETIQMSINW